MIWYIENSTRYVREEKALAALSARAAWLGPLKWRIDDVLRLVWEADILVGARTYPITLQYPHHFPNVPPSILPRGAPERWSGHQYGMGGELCLEWGPDNWHPEILGADMVESAYRLLSAEHPTDAASAVVPTRHVTSLGQDLRGVHSRFVQSAPLLEAVRELTGDVTATATLRTLFHQETYVVAVAAIRFPDETTWIDAGVPTDLEHEGLDQEALAWRWDPAWPLPETTNRETFIASLAERGKIWPTDRTLRFALIARGDELHLYKVLKDLVLRVAEIAPEAPMSRLAASHVALRERKVAIVGCGSLGSKIATALARSGVRRFLLVDDDLLLPGNLVRHDLDWRDVGTHKADAVARRARLVAPTAECETSKLRLGAQEASAGVDGLLSRLAGCDLVVDATAEPRAFNLISGAIASGKAAMVWAEVFGGGIGGLIARHRPDLEPGPQTMRQTIESWCAERNSPIDKAARDYSTGGDGTPLVASDADVSVIAAHAARLALDTMQGGTSSYPHSVYLVGLAHGWIFEQPFDTHPIDVGAPTDQGASESDSVEAGAALDRVVKLLGERGNASPPPA